MFDTYVQRAYILGMNDDEKRVMAKERRMRGIAIVVLMVVMIGVVGCGTNNNPTSATPDNPAVSTATVATVAPTAEAGTDTPSDSGGPVGEEQAYLTFFLEITDAYAAAFRSFGDLNQRAGADTDLLVDADWVREAQATATDIDAISQRVLDYEGEPKRFASAHTKLVTAADKLKQAMSFYRDGLDTIDVDSTTQAFSLIGEATGIVQEATQEIAGLINP